MSMMRYTYLSPVLGQELTLTLTTPEYRQNEHRPFAAALLVPDTARESDYPLRRAALERLCGDRFATAALPGRIALLPSALVLRFLMDELPPVLDQFAISPAALWAGGTAAPALRCIADALRPVYADQLWDEPIATLIDRMRVKAEPC